MQEDIEFALSHILDWRRIHGRYTDVRKFEKDVFVRAFFRRERERHDAGFELNVDPAKVWSRALFEESRFFPWPAHLDGKDPVPEYGVLSIVGKYRPINRRQLHEVLHGKRRPPIEIQLDAVGVKKATPKGSMYYYITKNEMLIITGHVARRLTERADLPDIKDFGPLSALHIIFMKKSEVDDEGIVLTSSMGAFLGHRCVLDKPVGSFPQGMKITLCKTFISFDMLRPEQRKRCHDACLSQVMALPGPRSSAILGVVRSYIGEAAFDERYGHVLDDLTSSGVQATLEEMNEGA